MLRGRHEINAAIYIRKLFKDYSSIKVIYFLLRYIITLVKYYI